MYLPFQEQIFQALRTEQLTFPSSGLYFIMKRNYLMQEHFTYLYDCMEQGRITVFLECGPFHY